jgi:hypothetical protein
MIQRLRRRSRSMRKADFGAGGGSGGRRPVIVASVVNMKNPA